MNSKRRKRLSTFQRLKVFLTRLGYVRRWIVFVAFFRGRTSGPIRLNRGIVYSPQLRLRFGPNVHLGAYGVFQGWGTVSIGARTYVGHHFCINAGSEILIGSDCMIANSVSIVDNNHGLAPSTPFASQGLSVSAVTIEDNCWIAEGAIILAGTRIGRGAVVAAGAVVRGDVEAGTIVGGVPAKLIRRL